LSAQAAQGRKWRMKNGGLKQFSDTLLATTFPS
jgi:hypothetical protein